MFVTSDWEKVQTLDADQIISYSRLSNTTDSRILSKLAILKLNNGLGASMGTYAFFPISYTSE